MNFLKNLLRLFTGGAPRGNSRYLPIYVLSYRCNEPIAGQVDLLNELSQVDEGSHAYFTRKALHTSGERRCFSQVDVTIYFNQNKQVVEHEVTGGRWLSADEYEAELTRFRTPVPAEDTTPTSPGAPHA
jgi:hypothetical protein